MKQSLKSTPSAPPAPAERPTPFSIRRKPLPASGELEAIIVKGAREHNLKNIDVELPKKKLIVFTGVSGSGKSSLAFDTIFAEGQRRYVESLSAYARQFIGQMEKPRYDTIRGLSPTISIEQKSASKNPRSTVGTITEIYDYLRVLFARIGEQYCYRCGSRVGRGDAQSMVNQIMEIPPGAKILILAPVIDNRKGEHRKIFQDLAADGFARVRVNGVVRDLEDIQGLEKHKKHTIEVVVDRLSVKDDEAFRKRLTDSVETALRLGRGRLVVHVLGREDLRMSEARSCCGIAYPELDPPLFSFNSPQGMCPDCNGIGSELSMDPEKIVPDKTLSIRQGAVIPWRGYFMKNDNGSRSWGLNKLTAMSRRWGIDFDTPWEKLPKQQRDLMLYGSKGREMKVRWDSEKIQGDITMAWEGEVNALMRRYLQTQSEGQKRWYAGFMSENPCRTCKGRRLKPEVLGVRVGGRSIIEITEMTVSEAHAFLSSLELTGNRKLIAEELLKEIVGRLGFLLNVGLDYLSLDRKGPTLSGGESQRIRLASQVGSELTGVLYILDEPSIGLHQRDNIKLLETLQHLRDIGNTLIVIEHDQETMEASDWIVDIGPGAGLLGGRIVAQGAPEEIRNNPVSLTGRYLAGVERIPVPQRRRSPGETGNHWIVVKGAAENNLAGITAKIPLGLLVAVTGVSGAGKSTLVNQILYPALARHLHQSALEVGKHRSVEGLDHLNKVINIDQKAIGRTPRSNPATYTKVFDPIRDFFALLPESRARGYKKGRFSFNVKGGRCEACSGDGYIKVEMHFLADVYVPCETCRGKRFNEATLQVKYKGHTIADVLDLSVREARELFAGHPRIVHILVTLMDVGLGYVKLGQSATTLSGGEAQRIKLARELARRDTGKTLYILDEPTTGLHFQDIRMLLQVLQRLVDGGNTVVVIEHNLDVIKTADWILDLGPEGGSAGGRITAQGPPEKVARSHGSYTGYFLREVLDGRMPDAGAAVSRTSTPQRSVP
ncbi:excinuclease ABC subunit UvrA [Desulfococcus multivorans]|uniref:UvrABC system protein A n=1 Tax=Desulfococcus multivorans DSM 2059 TaxID=1121405 RepID=S7UQ71_DESML|nr:excinuclease ABC subunit UvrA [Desulfococcus multivorans]AOY57112.1 UvrA: excinuclease UvrABC, subunit alpha [Desulfococcus multivorans]AQU99614.1 excinuclease ABC subunit A [Desulfococcus multivorans]EPR34468.1 UvrABC system protein A [Desulfococcus multivorans DSM 2059]SJZ87269.1 Excinuclease ABC subunit A [Desulfococcus multivorans DSM 2059]